MKKVLVLGSGAQGSTVARRLDLEPNVGEILIADYDKAAVDNLVGMLKKAKGFKVDASKEEEIVKLAQGCDLVVNALPLIFAKNVLEAALKVKADYQDFATGDNIVTGTDDNWLNGIKYEYTHYREEFKKKIGRAHV